MSYEVELLSRTRRDLARLDPAVADRVRRELETLGRDFEVTGHFALGGGLRGAFRLRIGDYRVIYTANHSEKRCEIHAIRHRREVYR